MKKYNSGIEEYKRKRFLVMGSKKFDYMKAISDISGFDIMSHENSMEKVLKKYQIDLV